MRGYLAFLVAAACSQGSAPDSAPAPSSSPPASPTAAQAEPKQPAASVATRKSTKRQTKAFADELADADRRIAGAKKLAGDQPTSFTRAEWVAGRYLDRARLSGDYRDYQQAEEWIRTSFGMNTGGSGVGPFQMRAALNFTLHRLERVDEDFAMAQKVPMDKSARASARQFAGNLALQRGQYTEAEKLLTESLSLDEGVSNLASKAYLLVGYGDYAGADALYLRAIDAYHGSQAEPLAWLHLQRGLADLGRGEYDAALAHYREAEQVMSGYWLIDEHIAEILTLTGKVEEAKVLYLDIIARTNNPEFMDAMAGIMNDEGKTAESKEYVTKARARYDELLTMYPEAAYGHALEHFLEFGEDPKFTLDLAEKNHKLRPNADAKTLLAQAYLLAGRPADARTIIESTLATPWRTADMHATAVAVFVAAGDAKLAEEHRVLARAINPKIELP